MSSRVVAYGPTETAILERGRRTGEKQRSRSTSSPPLPPPPPPLEPPPLEPQSLIPEMGSLARTPKGSRRRRLDGGGGGGGDEQAAGGVEVRGAEAGSLGRQRG
jgi:hypothetical protein